MSIKKNTTEEILNHYFNGDQNFNAQQEAQLVRLTKNLRAVITNSVTLNGSEEALTKLADQAEALNVSMKPLAGLRAMASHNKIFKYNDVAWSSPYSPINGRANPLSPPMFTQIKDDKAIGIVNCGPAYEGPPGCVHGGVVAMIWDHVLAVGTMVKDARGPTAYLTINYIRPTPLNTELRFEAWIEKQEGKKTFAKGRCYAGDDIVTEAEGLFIHTTLRDVDVTMDRAQQVIEKG